MTTITKERLLTIKQWRETYGPGSNVVLPAEEAEELARIALASLEAEPVAWTDEEELRDVRKYGFGEIFQCPPDKYADSRRVIPLYRELPAQVVPEEIAETSTNYPLIPGEVLSAIREVARIRADFDDFDGDRRGIGDCLDEAEQELIVTINKYASQLAVEPVVPVGLDERAAFNAWNNDENLPIAGVGAKNAAWLAWQARAELGHSLVVNSPVTPDGWISCSERMPDDKQYVWFFGESRGFAGRDTFEGYYDWSRNKWWAVTDIGEEPASKVTHWMPLPEPPQEAK